MREVALKAASLRKRQLSHLELPNIDPLKVPVARSEVYSNRMAGSLFSPFGVTHILANQVLRTATIIKGKDKKAH